MLSSPPRPDPALAADFAAEVAAYEQAARVARRDAAHYRMTYRVLGDGPTLVVVQGIASTYRGYAAVLNRLAARFRTVIYDYPGDDPTDGARLSRITHDDLVADLLGLLDDLGADRAAVLAASFGSTVLLSTLHRAPQRIPRAVIQGGFARRPLTFPERTALRFGRLVPGTLAWLPMRRPVLAWNNRDTFPVAVRGDRWPVFVTENGRTRIAGMAHRLDMLAALDLRPVLPQLRAEVLLIQGTADRIVPARYHEELSAGLTRAHSLILPGVGHQPHFTHPETLAGATEDFLITGLRSAEPR